jgi:sulfite reductase alpha subunit-like flavoprotein
VVTPLGCEQGEDVAQLLLDEAAHVYVCGDGAAMAKDVHACLLSVLEKHGGLSPEESTAKLAALTKQGRYVRDIWS